MSKKSGFEDILGAISLMNKDELETLMGNLTKMDFEMASKLKAKLYNLSDLQFITPQMMSEFLRAVDIKELSYAFKMERSEDVKKIIEQLPTRVCQEIEELMNKKIPKSQALEAHTKVKAIYTRMIDKEKIIISKDEKFV